MTSEIRIQALTTLKELELAAKLEESIWNFQTEPALTITMVKNGGMVLGAFDGNQLVGFTMGFAGFHQGYSYFCSHMLGVVPGYRDRNLGLRLKRKQAEVAGKLGYQMITWTFDPLETRNANLNLRKLGAVATTHKQNIYGNMQDGLNQGLPTDRFVLEWWFNSDHVRKQDQKPWMLEQAMPLYTVNRNPDHSLPEPDSFQDSGAIDAPVSWWVPVPRDFQGIKQTSMELALRWRLHTRAAFERLLAAGYLGVHLDLDGDLCRYLFVRRPHVAIPDRPVSPKLTSGEPLV